LRLASAAQVRRPIYECSAAQWRHHRTQPAQLPRLAREREAGGTDAD